MQDMLVNTETVFAFCSDGEERWYAPEEKPEKPVLRNRMQIYMDG